MSYEHAAPAGGLSETLEDEQFTGELGLRRSDDPPRAMVDVLGLHDQTVGEFEEEWRGAVDEPCFEAEPQTEPVTADSITEQAPAAQPACSTHFVAIAPL